MDKLFETAPQRALVFLEQIGIKADLSKDNTTLLVDRTSMCENFPVLGDEHASYQQVLDLIREEFSNCQVVWYGRTDDWMGVRFYKKGVS